MEPIDILGLKDPTVHAESLRKPIEIIKNKKQFEYSRLNEDDTVGRSSPVTAPSTAKNSPVINDDLLLIDLSPDIAPVPEAPTARPIYDQPVDVLNSTSDSDRIYANCPAEPTATAMNNAVSSNSNGRYDYHYYSQVPVEPISPVPAPLPPPPSNPVSPIKPVVSEELKKKRDEAFDWLGHALGELSMKKPSEMKPNDNQCNFQLTITNNETCIKPTASPHYGFDDDFSTAVDVSSKSRMVSSLENSAFFRHQQQLHQHPMDGVRQPYYPKPGVWTEENGLPTAMAQPELMTSSTFSSFQTANRAPSVQTAHVRPFMVAAPAQLANDGPSTSIVVNQVRLSAPWASEAEIKQALAIHGNKPLEALRFLQVEKLYR